MIRERPQSSQLSEPVPRVWGLDALQLHTAFWRSNGVQCIECGQREEPQPAADLYLLVEPRQLVLFNIVAMADELAWRNAAITRLRLICRDGNSYGEEVDVDERGFVRQIRRRYQPGTSSYRVCITRQKRIARLWGAASDRRTAWQQIRRGLSPSDRDSWRVDGQCFAGGSAPEDRRFIDALVSFWKSPDTAIDGIEADGDGVWSLAGRRLPPGAVAIGPAWIGTDGEDAAGCLVGPAWVEDIAPASEKPTHVVSVREIRDIEPGDTVYAGPAEKAERRVVYRTSKRLVDIVASSIVLLVFSPLLLAIAAVILITDGRPIFFGHLRQTRGGSTFRCWKLRTMRRNADESKRKLREHNACDGPQFWMVNDPRVTPIGRLLRRYHIDELPQLWNVIVGQMSLVGPRPSPEAENQFCPTWREVRLSVRPGITGLWQLKRTRKKGLDFQEWIRFDVEYVERASLLLDMQILCKTIGLVLRRK